MSLSSDLSVPAVAVVSPEQIARVVAGIAELQCGCRPGTERELVRLTALEPAQVRRAVDLLIARGTVCGVDSGGAVQYRLRDPRLPLPT